LLIRNGTHHLILLRKPLKLLSLRRNIQSCHTVCIHALYPIGLYRVQHFLRRASLVPGVRLLELLLLGGQDLRVALVLALVLQVHLLLLHHCLLFCLHETSRQRILGQHLRQLLCRPLSLHLRSLSLTSHPQGQRMRPNQLHVSLCHLARSSSRPHTARLREVSGTRGLAGCALAPAGVVHIEAEAEAGAALLRVGVALAP